MTLRQEIGRFTMRLFGLVGLVYLALLIGFRLFGPEHSFFGPIPFVKSDWYTLIALFGIALIGFFMKFDYRDPPEEAAQNENTPANEWPGCFVSNVPFWRLATLAFRLPSPQEGLTAVFGKRTGVTPPMKHQNGTLDIHVYEKLHTSRSDQERKEEALKNFYTRLPQFLSRVLSGY